MHRLSENHIIMEILSTFAFLYGVLLGNVVQIDQGQIIGSTLKSRSGRDFKAFQGIPYAQPPVGNLRFKEPEPAGSFASPLIAKFEPRSCIQVLGSVIIGSEDCLYLNVYTPKIPEKVDGELLPVMFWIHGGGFMTGSGGLSIYGPHYFLDKDVVMVTINYRLGVFGFLSTGDDDFPGNYGLKDQVLALKWVKNNIHYFGGDPNSITVLGESAGGGSVGLHLLSPMSKGLFHKAVMESASALNSWVVYPPSVIKRNALLVSNVTGCPAESKELVECLRMLPASELVDINNKSFLWTSDIILTPVPENCDGNRESFLCKYPLINFTQESKIPVLMGMNSGEGGFFASHMYNATNLVDDELKNNFDHYISRIMGYIFTAKSSDIPKISEKIRDRYYPDGSLEDPLKTVKMFTDGFFLNGIMGMAIKISPPVYYYVYDHLNKISANTLWGNYPYPSKLGVTHGDEILSLFYVSLLGPLVGQDLEVSKTMVNLWTRFVMSNDITVDGMSGGEKWPVFDADTQKYLLINSSSPVISEKPYKTDFEFWQDLPLLSGLKEA